MFWKCVQKKTKAKIYFLSRIKGSITFRLASIYIITAFGLLIIASLALYFNFVKYLQFSDQHSIIQKSHHMLFVILLLGLIIYAAAGIIITHRLLKPLRQITRSAQRITFTNLTERLNPSSWPYELSALANSFNHMLDRIEAGFLRLSQFSDDLAHEFRTPISNLRGEAEITLSHPRSNEEYRETLESSLEELLRLSKMIDNLLFLARAKNPQKLIERQAVTIENLYHDICDFYAALAEEKQIDLSFQGSGLVWADPNLLRRALSNLLSNALQHSNAGGLIKLSSQINADNLVKLKIQDNGKGIAAEHLPYIFDRFYRVEPHRSQHTGGSGLGLAIVKSIMELHQGKVSIASQLNQGTTVVLLFNS